MSATESADILVVEDDPSIATVMEEILSGQQYSVRLAGGPEECFQQIGERVPDLILMDINLGASIDGIETARRLREKTDIPVCFVTACSDEDTVKRAEAVDPMAYLMKPFETGDVTAMVRISLANARRFKEKLRQAERIQAAVRQSAAAVIFTRPDGTILSLTAGAEEFASPDTAGRPLWEALALSSDEDTSASAETLLRPHFGSGQPADWQWRGWLGPDPATRVPIQLVLSLDPGLGERICRLRKIPVAALRIGRNPAPAPVVEAGLTESATEDPLTGLPNRHAVERWIAGSGNAEPSVITLAIDHLPILRQRFGSAALDRIVLSYTQHLAQHLPESSQLARWGGPVFVVYPRADASADIEREVTRVLSSPLLYHLQLAGRSALLRVSCTFLRCAEGEQTVVELVDQFARPFLRYT